MDKTIMLIIGVILTIGALVVAYNNISSFLNKKFTNLRDWFNEPTKEELKRLEEQFRDKDYRDCQNDILDFLTDIENGERKTEVQIKHACSLYRHYCENLNGNSYVHDEWERVMNNRNRKI